MEHQCYHIPVLLHPAVDGLHIKRDGIYVDVTLGGGGHSREILKQIGPKGKLFSFDQDKEAIRQVQEDARQEEGRWTLINSNFRFLRNWMRYYQIEHIDGLLADLGVSSHHFDEAQRGFSFRSDAPLDMRMNQQANFTAADIVRNYSQQQLATIFRLYGELHQAPRIAAAIVKARQQRTISTTAQLAEILTPLLGHDRETKDLARAFQALRIEVNHEMDALSEMLCAAADLLAPKGRLVVIAYHSLEDRLVKNIIRTGNLEGDLQQDIYGHVLNSFHPVGKPIVPDNDELTANPRSRSARLRVAEKA